MRYLRAPKADMTGESSKGRVVTFLEQIYTSQAETLPDFRDTLGDSDLSHGYELDVTVKHQFHDAYGENVGKSGENKKTKCRQTFRSIRINPEKLKNQEVRHLPPGSMKDIYEQFCISEPEGAKVGFATFWRTWRSEFPNLRFRPYSSHAICNECIQHKLLVKDLSHHIKARSAQQALYVQHLDAQYQDRLSYWKSRSLSRMQSGELVTIIDSMDQAKFAFPRSSLFRTKDLNKCQRGRAHVTAAICHGFNTLLTISPPELPKDATTMIEILAHSMTLAQRQGAQLDQLCYVVQCDNTPRECKNNYMLKYLCYIVANGVCKSASLRSLRSGHSHEDVDQEFGNLARFMSTRVRLASTLTDFRDAIHCWQTSAMKRPHESEHHAVLLDQTRSWRLLGKKMKVFYVTIE